ncbi:variable surface protein, partial [Plasmodium gonderi]
MPPKEADKFTKTHLPSVKFYKMLDNDFSKLVSFRVEYCSNFPSTYGRNKKIKELCVLYINYLKKQDNILRKYNYNEDYCKLISYWVSERLLETNNIEPDKSILAFSDIQDFWSKATKLDPTNYKCLPYSDIYNFYNNWEKAKKLYDYYIDFDDLKNMTNNCGEKCEELCRYLNEANDIYKSYNDYCSGNENNLCPLSKDEYVKCHPKSLLKMFNCNTSTDVKILPQEELYAEGYEEGPSREGGTSIEEGYSTEADPIIEGVPSIEDVLSIEEARSTPFSKEDSKEDSELIRGEWKHLITFGNSLLGLVLASMLFGVLYIVNDNYINLYNFTYI